jgi:hypothetical protein
MLSVKSGRDRGRIHPVDGAFLGGSGSEPDRGSVAVIMDFVPMSLAQYEQMVEQLKVQRSSADSLSPLFHWYRVYPDGIRVIEIWPSRSAFAAFLEKVLQPMVKDVGLPQAHLSYYDVPRVAQQE